VQPDLANYRIAFVAGTLGRAGAEQQLFYIVQGLVAAGASVAILSLTRGEFWESRIERLGAPVIYVGERDSRLARLERITREVRRLRSHIVQSQHFYTNIYSAIAARRTGARDIGAIRGNAIAEVRANGPIFGRLSLRLPRTLVANSEVGMHNAVALGVPERKLFLLPNVVDTSRFSPSNRVAGAAVRVLSVGRLVALKRHDGFLRSIAACRDAGQRVEATIAGEGPLRKELEELAASLSLKGTVEFAGGVEDMPALYRRSDILVLNSEHEGTPNVVLEAMSCGLPVLATAVGGVPALIRDGQTGILATPGEERQLTEKLSALIGDPNVRAQLGRQARAFIVARHSPASIAANLALIYRNERPGSNAGALRQCATRN
jgi:glycosyltransferase involved in cell wall biosynthesis